MSSKLDYPKSVPQSSWLRRDLLSLDLETTGVDTGKDRIVTLSLQVVQPSSELDLGVQLLVNPGVPIPAGATAVHGIGDAQAAEGMPHHEALQVALLWLEGAAARGLPVVVFNACFDLTLLSVQAQALGLRLPPRLLVLDPLVIDRALQPYRKGSRKLGDLCQLYGVELDNAHDSSADSLAAAQLMQAIGRRYPKVTRVSLQRLMTAQRRAHERWAISFRRYLRRQGSDRHIDTRWPIQLGGESA